MAKEWRGSDLRARAEVLGWLRRHGGEVHDPSGGIVGRMRVDLNKGRAISQLVADMAHDGMLKREVNGRRTMMLAVVEGNEMVKMVDARWRDELGSISTPIVTQADGAIPAGTNYEQLADTLLAICVKRATAPIERDHAEVAKLRAELKALQVEHSKLQGELTETRDALLMAREAEAEQRRQADTMRESLAKFQRQANKPKRGGGSPLVERLSPEEKRTLKVLMESLPDGR